MTSGTPSCTMFNSVPTEYLLQGYRRLHFAGQVRVVELVRVADAFVRHQFEILAAEGVAVAGGEVRERHLVGAADFGVQVVNLAGEPVRRKPFGHRVGVEERPIDSFRRRTQHAVKSDGVCGHDHLAFLCRTPKPQKAKGLGAHDSIIALRRPPRCPDDSAKTIRQSASTCRASGPSRACVSGCMRAAKSVPARPSRGINAPWIDRRGPLDVFAVWPCHADPLKMSSEPARPHANTCPSCSARRSDMVSSGVPDHRCEPGTKRVAPLSGRNSSTIRMKPSSGQSAESRRTSTCSSWAGEPGRSVRACSELSLNGRPMTRQHASSSGGKRRGRRTRRHDSRSRSPSSRCCRS